MRSLEGYHEIRIMCHVKLSYLSEYQAYLMLFEHNWPCALHVHNYVWGFKTTIKLHLALARTLSIIFESACLVFSIRPTVTICSFIVFLFQFILFQLILFSLFCSSLLHFSFSKTIYIGLYILECSFYSCCRLFVGLEIIMSIRQVTIIQ